MVQKNYKANPPQRKMGGKKEKRKEEVKISKFQKVELQRKHKS